MTMFGAPSGLSDSPVPKPKPGSSLLFGAPATNLLSEKENIFGTPITSLLSGDSQTNSDDISTLNDFPASLESSTPLDLTSLSVSSSRPSVSGIPVSTFDGKRFTLKRKPKTSRSARDALEKSSAQRVGSLLDVPVHRLLDNIAREKTQYTQLTPRVASSTSERRDDALWVDRYRPQQFTELTGNERTGREAMAWVKEWDYCVFGKRKGKKRARGENENDDPYQRPREKFLLLSGPPGLGKTTLAHIVAKHAGYDAMEINASDARSGREVEERIKPALESGSQIGSTKPILLVLDEIDGATGGDNSSNFISKLLYLLQDKPRKKSRAGQSKQEGKRPILRPIICICNDYNASTLTKLRPHAFHVRFYRPADIHTVNRLRNICELEGLKSDARALSSLVGVAKGDMRGCINTLQFIKSKDAEVTEQIVRKATVGMKENETSILAALNNLFVPLSKKRCKDLALTDEEETRYVSRLSKEIDSTGKDQSIAIGCFSQYISRRQHDPHFNRFEKACDWLAAYDVMSSHMYSDGDFATLAYLPYTLVPFFPLFNERGTSIKERNNEDWENLQVTRANEEVYKSLSKCIRTAGASNSGDFRSFITTPNLQLEFAPYLNRIISPPLKPINQQVVKPGERQTLTRLVKIMCDLELNFVQERAEDGQLAYRLDPPIDVFVTYDGKRASDIAVSRYAFRHMVACEMDAKLGSRDSTIDLTKAQPNGSKANATANDDSRPSKRLKIQGKETDTVKVAVDFFGRPIVPKLGGKVKKLPPVFQVGYKFLEGNSAAVRKPIKVEAFL